MNWDNSDLDHVTDLDNITDDLARNAIYVKKAKEEQASGNYINAFYYYRQSRDICIDNRILDGIIWAKSQMDRIVDENSIFDLNEIGSMADILSHAKIETELGKRTDFLQKLVNRCEKYLIWADGNIKKIKQGLKEEKLERNLEIVDLAKIALSSGDVDKAIEYFNESIEICKKLNLYEGIKWAEEQLNHIKSSQESSLDSFEHDYYSVETTSFSSSIEIVDKDLQQEISEMSRNSFKSWYVITHPNDYFKEAPKIEELDQKQIEKDDQDKGLMKNEDEPEKIISESSKEEDEKQSDIINPSDKDEEIQEDPIPKEKNITKNDPTWN